MANSEAQEQEGTQIDENQEQEETQIGENQEQEGTQIATLKNRLLQAITRVEAIEDYRTALRRQVDKADLGFFQRVQLWLNNKVPKTEIDFNKMTLHQEHSDLDDIQKRLSPIEAPFSTRLFFDEVAKAYSVYLFEERTPGLFEKIEQRLLSMETVIADGSKELEKKFPCKDHGEWTTDHNRSLALEQLQEAVNARSASVQGHRAEGDFVKEGMVDASLSQVTQNAVPTAIERIKNWFASMLDKMPSMSRSTPTDGPADTLNHEIPQARSWGAPPNAQEVTPTPTVASPGADISTKGYDVDNDERAKPGLKK